MNFILENEFVKSHMDIVSFLILNYDKNETSLEGILDMDDFENVRICTLADLSYVLYKELCTNEVVNLDFIFNELLEKFTKELTKDLKLHYL